MQLIQLVLRPLVNTNNIFKYKLTICGLWSNWSTRWNSKQYLKYVFCCCLQPVPPSAPIAIRIKLNVLEYVIFVHVLYILILSYCKGVVRGLAHLKFDILSKKLYSTFFQINATIPLQIPRVLVQDCAPWFHYSLTTPLIYFLRSGKKEISFFWLCLYAERI